MRKFPFYTIGMLLVVCIGVVALNAFTGGSVSNFFAAATSRPSIYVFDKMRGASLWFQGIKSWAALIEENTELKRQNIDLVSRSARIRDIEEENDFLRAAAGIAKSVPNRLVDARLFAVATDAAGYHGLLNKGSQDGITVGDVVVSGEGVLVGQVAEASPTTVQVRFISDPSFEITARVIGGTTTGIARGNLGQGMTFDLVAQEDTITEGDTIVSSGNDRFPAGLVIGTVEHVDEGESKLFKDVRIRPAMDTSTNGRIIIITKP